MTKTHSWWARVEPGSIRPWRRDRIQLCAMTDAVHGDDPHAFTWQPIPNSEPTRWALNVDNGAEEWTILGRSNGVRGYRVQLNRARFDTERRFRWAERVEGRPWKGNIDELCDLLASVPVLDSTETGVAS